MIDSHRALIDLMGKGEGAMSYLCLLVVGWLCILIFTNFLKRRIGVVLLVIHLLGGFLLFFSSSFQAPLDLQGGVFVSTELLGIRPLC